MAVREERVKGYLAMDMDTPERIRMRAAWLATRASDVAFCVASRPAQESLASSEVNSDYLEAD